MRRLLLIVPAAALTAAAAAGSHHWSYSGGGGPAHWGETCAAGKAQSPIDIRSASAPVKALPPLEFHYRPGPLHIVDTGHSIEVRPDPGSSVTIAGRRFELVQYHFHKPAEETIDGRRFAMSVHLVHRDNQGKQAVVAVPLNPGAANPVMSAVRRNLPSKQGTLSSPARATLDPSRLLPAQRSYFTYKGSLTTPPCSEGVRWFVLRSPQSILPADLSALAHRYPANARPVQPLNGRAVLASK